MNEPIEDINPLDIQITPPKEVTRSGIKKLIDFFKKDSGQQPDIQQIETPTEDDLPTVENQKEDNHDDDDDNDDDD